MPHMAMKLEDAPIVIARVTGRLNATVHFRLSQEVANLIEGVPGKIYRINDLIGVQVTLRDMTEIIYQMAKNWAGTASDPRIKTTMVLDNPNMFLGMTHMARRWNWAAQIQVCPTLLDALRLARAEIASLREVQADRVIT
jgi:hypothetical protein